MSSLPHEALKPAGSPWLEHALPRFPVLRQDLEVDVVVVGAGITGVTAAWLLRQAGRSVALIDRDRIGAADSGHTTAHLTCVTDARLHQLVRHFGEEGAAALWHAGGAAINQIEAIVQDTGAPCGFRRVPGYLHVPRSGDAAMDEQIRSLQQDATLAAHLGFDARFVAEVPWQGTAGIQFAAQAAFDPGAYLATLVHRLAADGVQIFENTALTCVEAKPRRVVADGGYEMRCGYVVLATHNPPAGSLGALRAGLFQSKLSLYTSYVLGARVPSGTLPDALYWDTSDPYEYLRIQPRDDHDLVIFGGCDSKTGQGDDNAAFAALERRLAARVPGAEVSHRWLGQVIETDDGLPYIGEHADGEFIATGFAGNGYTFGTLAAMMARDSVLGRSNPWAGLLRVDRKPLHGGLMRYLRENLDYPAYLLRDRLGAPQARALDDVPRGEGRIVALEPGRCAVYRDATGGLSICSAVCTHLKCLVRWNAAAGSWDCPCHGSRFAPDGQVLAGPAEEPLQRIELREG